ncbi:MAG: FAD-binding oxidoreductase [Nevskiaceae bacterium]|jgi:gamma-glutamylputrescine oxidase|nr:FAD-binding oxidoreductase [Nevskiaceae bacterium]
MHTPWYWTSTSEPAPLAPLQGDADCDVGIVGGGLAGISAALHLAQRGYRVTVLEAQRIGWGASGRSGAQALPGVAASQQTLRALIGDADARRVWEMSVEALSLMRQQITAHHIDCDLIDGQIHAAIKPRQHRELIAWTEELRKNYGYTSVQMLDHTELREHIDSKRYLSGMLDTNAAHLQPLKYLRGLADAARSAGALIHEHTRATHYSRSAGQLLLHTAHGNLACRHILFAGNAWLGRTVPSLARRIMPVGTYIIATEPLDHALATSLLPKNTAITDINWVLDYFRRSSDHRLLFGGRVSYSGLDPLGTARATRQRMLRVFPQLAQARITHAWGGYVDITMNRAPDFGRLEPDVYYLQGFSGHGIALTGIAGLLAAEAIAGVSERFDVFTRIAHRPFPGGALLRRPLLVLAMLYFRLRDLL